MKKKINKKVFEKSILYLAGVITFLIILLLSNLLLVFFHESGHQLCSTLVLGNHNGISTNFDFQPGNLPPFIFLGGMSTTSVSNPICALSGWLGECFLLLITAAFYLKYHNKTSELLVFFMALLLFCSFLKNLLPGFSFRIAGTTITTGTHPNDGGRIFLMATNASIEHLNELSIYTQPFLYLGGVIHYIILYLSSGYFTYILIKRIMKID